MPFDRLAGLVARMPSWLPMILTTAELNLNPPGGASYTPPRLGTRSELLQALDSGVEQARQALQLVSDDEIGKPWRLLVSGKTVRHLS